MRLLVHKTMVKKIKVAYGHRREFYAPCGTEKRYGEGIMSSTKWPDVNCQKCLKVKPLEDE